MAPTCPCSIIWKELPNIRCVDVSVAIRVHHLSASATPSCASVFIFLTVSCTFSRTRDSQFCRRYVLLKARARSFLRTACCFGSVMVKRVGRGKGTSSWYHWLLLNPDAMRWIWENAFGSATEISNGVRRTKGPYFSWSEWT